ncbi:hypothetical protein Pelo_659 [Pelomyxa schiedti]|nr:hypothetical protein Pelo_659 [Pelomyxa schiedti]
MMSSDPQAFGVDQQQQQVPVVSVDPMLLQQQQQAAMFVAPQQIPQSYPQQVPVDPVITAAAAKPQAVGDSVTLLIGGNLSTDQVVQNVKTSGMFKFHALGALALSVLCFLLWMFIGIGVGWFPWFIYPIALSLMTLSAHFYIFIRPKEWLQMHFIWYVVLNCTMFVSWEASEVYSCFFVYSLFILTEILGVHIILSGFRRPDNMWLLYLHVLTFANLNLIIFFAYLDTRNTTTQPWFAIPLFVLACLLVVHYCIQTKKGWFTLHVYLFSAGQLAFFALWVTFGTDIFPWFIAPLALWGLALGVHYYLQFIKHMIGGAPAQPAGAEQPASVPPPDNTAPTYMVNTQVPGGTQPVYVVSGVDVNGQQAVYMMPNAQQQTLAQAPQIAPITLQPQLYPNMVPQNP